MGTGGDGGGNGATVTVGAEGVTVGAGGVVGLEQAASAKPISITIDRRIIARTNGSYSWGVHEIGTRRAQQFFHFLDGSANCTANHVVQLDLALQLNDSLICEIETLCQDCRNVQEYDGILFE